MSLLGRRRAVRAGSSVTGGAISVAVYLTMVGAGADYGTTQLIGAVVVGAAVFTTLLIMPRVPAPEPERRT